MKEKFEPLASEASSAFAAATADFAATLPSKLDALEAALEEVRRGEDPGATERLRVLAHRLRGTAASYGFPMVGTAVARIEDAAKGLRPADPAHRAVVCTDIERALRDARYAALGGRPASARAVNLTHARVLLVDDDADFHPQVA